MVCIFKTKTCFFLAQKGILWPLEHGSYWWILTDYPQLGDHFNWLDGFSISFYILGSGLCFGAFLSLSLSLIGRLHDKDNILKRHLAQAYLPVAAAGLFLGLTATTVSLLRYSGVSISGVSELRMVILAGSALWSVLLGRGILTRYPLSQMYKLLGLCAFIFTLLPILAAWWLIFWGW